MRNYIIPKHVANLLDKQTKRRLGIKLSLGSYVCGSLTTLREVYSEYHWITGTEIERTYAPTPLERRLQDGFTGFGSRES